MIVLFSENYNVTLAETSDTKLPHATARINREATLDGGVSFQHLGVSHGDRTFHIRANVTRAEAADLNAMHEEETTVLCATAEGVFSGAISSLSDRRGAMEITYFVESKID